MNQETSKIKYVAYCRKSSEDKERQVASIADQKRELREYAERENIHILKFFEESQSAHVRGRPIFGAMMAEFENGLANGLLVWHPNRIARNAFDGGWIITTIDESKLREVRTPYRVYGDHSDDKFFLQLEFGMAKKDSDDKGIAVKRAIKRKLSEGWRPSPAPIGYINIGDIGNKTIGPDPDRFDIAREMWDLFLTGTYSVSKIRDIANNQWGLRTLSRKKLGGKPLSMSHMYSIFNDPFYYGEFLFKNPETGERQLYQGAHQPMITKKEFERAQILLGRKGKPQPKNKEFAFTGLILCGECGCSVTAEEKHQVICTKCKHKFSCVNTTVCSKCGTDISEMKDPTILEYIYYHCTKKKSKKCTQRSIRLEKFEAQFNIELENKKIDDDYLKLALDYLNEKQELDEGKESAVTKSLQSALNDCQTRLNTLNKEYTSPQNARYEIYTPEEFSEYKKELKLERVNFEQQLKESQSNLDQVHELTTRTFNFCAYAHYHFNNGGIQTKRDIFANIGSNLTLMDQKVSIEAYRPYILIENELAAQRELFEGLEPTKIGYAKRKEEVFASSVPSWLPG